MTESEGGGVPCPQKFPDRLHIEKKDEEEEKKKKMVPLPGKSSQVKQAFRAKNNSRSHPLWEHVQLL